MSYTVYIIACFGSTGYILSEGVLFEEVCVKIINSQSTSKAQQQIKVPGVQDLRRSIRQYLQLAHSFKHLWQLKSRPLAAQTNQTICVLISSSKSTLRYRWG